MRNLTDAFTAYLKTILDDGHDVEVRGYKTKEIMAHTAHITYPRERCLALPERKDDIVAKCAETLWMLAGRQDITWLTEYLPRAADFSDDTLNWRGAYGPRLRHWYGVDQIKYVHDLLTKDPYSRQAIINLWDPTLDTQPGKDIPCNNWLQFLARPRADAMTLNLHVAQRSSDIWWGFSGIDIFSWGILHDLMANWLGMELGSHTQFIGSFHLYERHFKTAQRFLARWGEMAGVVGWYTDIYAVLDPLPTVKSTGDFKRLDKDLATIFEVERMARTCPNSLNDMDDAWNNRLMGVSDNLLRTLGEVMVIGLLAKHDHWELALELLDTMDYSDLYVSLVEYLTRHYDNPAMLDLLSNLPPQVYTYVYDVCYLAGPPAA